jgi:glyoxylase-like metal-dependent hydrolase (beta-lactamase superfamily II)
MRALQITPQVTALTSTIEIPMLGVLPINAFLIKGSEPMLVDTGITPERDEFLAALEKLIDPADLRWIWLTHADRDHTGSISELLERAPNARVATTFVTLGLMGVGNQPIPPERAYVVRDGTHVPIESGELIALRPPLFDNPGTAGFFDPSSRVLFSSDFFGGLMPSHEHALSDDVASVATDDVVAGQLLWGSADAPWVHTIDEAKLGNLLDEFRRFDADVVLSTHLPPIRGNVDQHLKTIAMLPSSPPTMTPDQPMLEAAMAEIAHGS